MSENGSPTGGQQPNTENDPNGSIIEKVRSRVSSIIPHTFSKWFSPTTTSITDNNNERSRNGSIRRKRQDMLGEENDGDDTVVNRDDIDNSDNSTNENDDIHTRVMVPPLKRTKLNTSDSYLLANSYDQIIRDKNSDIPFLSSTPTFHRRKNLDLQRKSVIKNPPYNFSGATTSSFISSAETRREFADKPIAVDVEEDCSDAYRKLTYKLRRRLNIPRVSASTSALSRLPNLRRQTLTNLRANEDIEKHISSSSHLINEQELLEDEEDDDDQEEENGTIINNDEEFSKIEHNRKYDKRRLTNGIGTPSNVLNDSASESGESQCSSIQRRKVSGLFGAGAKRLRTSIGSGLNFAAHLQGEKSLFCDKNMSNVLNNSTTSLTSLNRRQSFNASLYGSTSALSDSRLLNTSSPFYKGRTTYGGASAYNKYSQQTNRTIRAPTLIRPSSSLSTLSSTNSLQTTDTTSALSNTAKRILDLMNQFTTPLTDAKKMASNTMVPALTAHKKRFGEADIVSNRGVRMSMPKTPYSRPIVSLSNNNNTKQIIPPTSELQVPSMSQLLQMKKLLNNTERVREIASSSKSILNQKEEYKLAIDGNQHYDNNNGPTKHVNKIKNKLTSTRSSSRNNPENDAIPAVNLPNIPLPLMKSVPKIVIVISKESSSPAPIANQSLQSSNMHNSQFSQHKNVDSKMSGNLNSQKDSIRNQSNYKIDGKMESINNNSNKTISKEIDFKFSSPIQIQMDTKKTVEPINNFKFSEPFSVNNSINVTPLSSNASTIFENFKHQSNEKLKLKESISGNNSQMNSISNNSSKVQQLKSGSVLDALKVNTNKLDKYDNVVKSSFGDKFKKSSDKWECSVCLIRNDNNISKCVACGNAAPTAVNSETSSVFSQDEKSKLLPIQNAFGDKFKPKSDTWECKVCLVRNKSNDKNCVACNSANSSIQATNQTTLVPKSTLPTTSDVGFKSIVANQSSKWECSACMTRNEQTRTKCVCCEQIKPGAVSETTPQGFSFGATKSNFTFGFSNQKEDELKSSGTSDNSKIISNDKDSKPTGFIFGSNKSLTATNTPSTFSFGIKSSNAPTETNDVADSPKTSSGFSFGLSKTQPQTSVTNENKNSEINDKTKSSPLIKKSETSDSQPGGFKFATPSLPSSATLNSKDDNLKNNSSKDNQSAQGNSTASNIFQSISGQAFASTTPSVSKIDVNTNKNESVKLGGFVGFGSSTSGDTNKLQEGNNKIVTSSTSAIFNSSSPSSGTFIKQNSDISTSNDGAKQLFAFGSSATDKNNKNSADNKSGFAFVTSNKITTEPSPVPANPVSTTSVATNPSVSSLFTFGYSNKSSTSSISSGISFTAQTSTQPSTTSSLTSSSTPAFVFGKSLTSSAATPSFGTISSNAITSTHSSTGTVPTFGASTFGSCSTATATFGSTAVPQPTQQQNVTFGSSFSASNNAQQNSSNSSQTSNLFSFGAATTEKTENSAPIFGSVSSTTANKVFSFGSNSSINPSSGTGTVATTPAPFAFGSSLQKPSESTPIFGNPTGSSTALPAFNSFSSPVNNNNNPQQATTFGQPSAMVSPFGSNVNNPPAFGSSSVAPASGGITPSMFGSTTPAFGTASTFGSANNNTNNNNTPTFGNVSQNQNTTFGSFGAIADHSQAKKVEPAFNFGATGSQNSTAGFSFGSNNNSNNNNNNNTKQPFAFSTSSAPTFNFTGSKETTNSSQPFQFGAAPSTPTVFKFSGVETNTNTGCSSIPTWTSKDSYCNKTYSTAIGHQLRGWLKPKGDIINRTTMTPIKSKQTTMTKELSSSLLTLSETLSATATSSTGTRQFDDKNEDSNNSDEDVKNNYSLHIDSKNSNNNINNNNNNEENVEKKGLTLHDTIILLPKQQEQQTDEKQLSKKISNIIRNQSSRKFLLNLHSKKLYQFINRNSSGYKKINKLIVKKPKLYYLSENHIFKKQNNNNRYKFIKKDLIVNESGETSNNEIIKTDLTEKCSKLLLLNRNRKTQKQNLSYNFNIKSSDPSKYKYVKPINE